MIHGSVERIWNEKDGETECNRMEQSDPEPSGDIIGQAIPFVSSARHNSKIKRVHDVA